MKRMLAVLTIALACSIATMPAMAQDATAAPTQQAAPAQAATPAATATPAQEGPVGPAPADKAQIVFFRPSKFAGAAVKFKVREGEQEFGKLGSGDYFIVTVAPGKHTYTVHSEAKDDLNMEVDAGETYYVQGTISMGFMVGHPHLAPSDKATFDGMSSKLTKTTL